MDPVIYTEKGYGLHAAVAHRDALAKLSTFDDVAAYDLTAGWPVV